MTGQFFRSLWVYAGYAFLVLGVVGIVVPLWPTTPFLLLAAYCFARGSERLHNWLLNHPVLGAPIIDWRDHGAISAKAKKFALIAIFATPFITYFYGASWWTIGVQIVILSFVAYFIWSRPLPPS